ncbi:MAG TPA: ribosome maturation factor RimM [Allosphingosinicella sp.]|nr:ribosome maturation factor RimM [Allosphingosinicella sp.]
MADQVTLAAVAGAHGVGGEVRLKLFAEGLDSLKLQKTLYAGERQLTLKSVRPGGAGAIARFAEIADRSAAEALRGALLTVPREALPPLAEGEYYHADLIGLACVDGDGTALGTVVAVENFGAGDLLEIERPDGRKTLIPFRPGIADLAGGRIIADPAFLA